MHALEEGEQHRMPRLAASGAPPWPVRELLLPGGLWHAPGTRRPCTRVAAAQRGGPPAPHMRRRASAGSPHGVAKAQLTLARGRAAHVRYGPGASPIARLRRRWRCEWSAITARSPPSGRLLLAGSSLDAASAAVRAVSPGIRRGSVQARGTEEEDGKGEWRGELIGDS